MARAKCKRGTTVTLKEPLLSEAARAAIRQGGNKSARALLNKVVVSRLCEDRKGNTVVKSVTVKKGQVGGAPRRRKSTDLPAPRQMPYNVPPMPRHFPMPRPMNRAQTSRMPSGWAPHYH